MQILSNVYLSICDFKKSLVSIAPSWPTGLLFKQSRSGHLGQHHLWYFQIDFMPPLFDSNDIYYRAAGTTGGGHRLPRFSRLINCSNKGEGGRLCLSYYYLPHRFSDLPTVLHQIICANHGESVKIDSIVWLTIFSSYSSGNIFFNATITHMNLLFFTLVIS